ncbi:MAM domain-containing protein [Cardiosporidium cionae]|uniref:Amine oxidase n=1 Tax=Cardiosporidium cionae TaxID=476202 RepID=A0ABQ7J470_9APIC|nr:MAM domain-containing protein [Cardiosporidium cionae]|eukprot:KAF8817906.1 MAM domain-containing protein [Cardiosporidium cionae]
MVSCTVLSHPLRHLRKLANISKQGIGSTCFVSLSTLSCGGNKFCPFFIRNDFRLNVIKKHSQCFPCTNTLSEPLKLAVYNFHAISSRRRGSSKRSDEENASTKGETALSGILSTVADSYWAKTVDHLYDSAIVDEWKSNFANLQQYDHEVWVWMNVIIISMKYVKCFAFFADLLEWRRAFDVIDRDDDGFISQADLQKTPTFSLDKSRLLKINVHSRYISIEYDRDQNNLIDFGEFVEAMFNVDIKTLKDNFEGFDSVDIQLEFEKHAETNPVTSLKTLSLEHLKEMMKEFQFTCVTKTDAKRLFDCMDTNKDGNIDFEDFKTSLQPDFACKRACESIFCTALWLTLVAFQVEGMDAAEFKECATLVYTNRESSAAIVESNRETCRYGSGRRAFLLDVGRKGLAHPILREAAPDLLQKFACRPMFDCKIIVTGFGLRWDDAITLAPPGANCPPEQNMTATKQNIRAAFELNVTTSLLADYHAQQIGTYTFLPVFELGTLESGEYNICYAVRVSTSLFTCDFNQDMCSFKKYKNNNYADLNWERRQRNSTQETDLYTNALNNGNYYLFMESPQFLPGASATVIGPLTIFPLGYNCVQLSFNMHAGGKNSLRLYLHYIDQNIQVGGNWGSPSWVSVGNNENEWRVAKFEFKSDGKRPAQLVIEALSGDSEKGDVAVDDISIMAGHCSDNRRERLMNNQFVCGEVRLISGDWNVDKSWYVEGALSCAGRGYNLEQVITDWVPCCVPTFGNYTLVLLDQFGDGWADSQLEFRFFDETMRIGKDFNSLHGTIKKYTITIGNIAIRNIRGTESYISFEVAVHKRGVYVWCAATEDGSDHPSLNLIKKYGIRSPRATSKISETISYNISSYTVQSRILKPNILYALHCIIEDLPGVALSNNEKIKTTQFNEGYLNGRTTALVSTDSTAPQLHIVAVNSTRRSIRVMISVQEESKIWCYPSRSEGLNRIAIGKIKSAGTILAVHDIKQMVRIHTLELEGLQPDTNYTVFCYAEDFAFPQPNGFSLEEVQKLQKTLRTKSADPHVTIDSHRVFANGFVVSVKVDVPGKVWCGAAQFGTRFPTREDVKNAGAQTYVDDITKIHDIVILGVEQNTRYTLYCVAESRNGNAVTGKGEMREKSVEVTSYGEFCKIPKEPEEIQTGQATPFDPITATEEFFVRDFMISQYELALEGVYRVTLFHNKTEILQYYDKNGPFPRRYARVRAGSCENGKGYYKQFKVGPLNAEKNTGMVYELLGVPIQTRCGGYAPQGVFGRRLGDTQVEESFSEILEKSFGYPFNSEKCRSYNSTKCLILGPVFYEQYKESQRVWIGLKTPDQEQLPFYFIVKENANNSIGILEQIHIPTLLYSHEVQGFWYNGQTFRMLDDLVKAFKKRKLNLLSPSILSTMRKLQRKNVEGYKRSLGPSLSGPHANGRRGLEYRVAPEHVEPQGKRFYAIASPSGDTYTISYAGWEFTVTNDRDLSLRLWNIKFKGKRMAFEAGLMEAFAHYSVADRDWYFMDSWYGGLGSAARRLHRGIECARTGILLFWDKSLCVFEQDLARPLRAHWKSGQLRDGAPHLALVLRQMLTVSNYDYVSDYVFQLNGVFEGSISFTGELYAGVEVPWFSARQRSYGTQISSSMRMGALHNHMAIWKIDYDVQGEESNSILWNEVISDPKRFGAHMIKQWFAESEEQATLIFNGTRALKYFVVNENRTSYGNVAGFEIKSLQNIAVQQPRFEAYSGPVSWTKYSIFSTVRKDSELDASLPRDNKYADAPAVDVDNYIQDMENIRHQDIVTWVTSGMWHIPVVEDMPLTTSIGNTLGFRSKPSNFFTEDPSMDLHNSMSGDVHDPGVCAILRSNIDNAIEL